MLTGSTGLLIIGFVVGGIGTVIGAGGGFLLVPTLLLLDPHISPEVAAGISLAVVFFNASSGSIAYARMGRVDFRAGTIFAIAAMPGAIIGAYTTAHIPRRVFDGIFGFLLIAACLYLLTTSREKADKPAAGDYNLGLGIAISTGIGFVSSLLGIGGGIIHVPALTQALKFSVHKATATSHYVLSITALVATLIRLKNGTLDGHFVQIAWLSLGAVAGAQAGAKLSNRLRGSWILRLLAIGLGLIGVRILLPLF